MESSTAQASPIASVDATTMAEAFRLTVDRHGDKPAVRTKDDEISLTWSEMRDRVTLSPVGSPHLASVAGTPSRSCSRTDPSSISPTWRR